MKLTHLAVVAATLIVSISSQAQALSFAPPPEFCATKSNRVVHRGEFGACRPSETRVQQDDLVLCARKNRPVSLRAFSCKKSEARLLQIPAPSLPDCGCTTLWRPVCGTDGRTYSNAGCAACAVVSIAYEGECESRSKDVSVTLDQFTYARGEAVSAELTNGTSESIFLPGCGEVSFQKRSPFQSSSPVLRVPAPWVDIGPQIACFWEGTAREVKPGETKTVGSFGFSDASDYRFRVDYSVGCTPGAPLSSGNCSSSNVIYSNAFTVR